MSLCQRAADLAEKAKPLFDDARAGIEKRRVPDPEVRPAGLVLPDGPEQAVALGQSPAVCREVGGVARRQRARELVDHPSSEARRPGHQKHVLGREQDDSQPLFEGADAAGHPVHSQALALALSGGGAARSNDRELDRRRGIVRGPLTDSSLDPQRICTETHELRIGRRASRSTAGRQDDRLEEARLARRVRSEDEDRARREGDVERSVRPEIRDAEVGQQGAHPVPVRTVWAPIARRVRRSSGPA